jgi:hypothetical protein
MKIGQDRGGDADGVITNLNERNVYNLRTWNNKDTDRADESR